MHLKYFKITDIQGENLIDERRDHLSYQDCVQARLRPWLPEEAIGKVIMEAKCYYIISAASEFKVITCGETISMDTLINKHKQPDGSPCGVLEHLKDGVWTR